MVSSSSFGFKFRGQFRILVFLVFFISFVRVELSQLEVHGLKFRVSGVRILVSMLWF